MSQIFESKHFVEAEVLLKCLVDATDDAIIIDGLKSSSASESLLMVKMIVEMRRGLLDHLSLVYPSSSIHDAPFDENAVSSSASLIKMAFTISRMLPSFRKAIGGGTSAQVTTVRISSS